MDSKIAGRPIAKGIPSRTGGFAAQFALPGYRPRLLRDKDGDVISFETMQKAASAAAAALMEDYVRRFSQPRFKNNYELASPEQFAAALVEARVSAKLFADLYGTSEWRVASWLNGDNDVPHNAHVMAVMLRHDAAFSEAERLMNERISTDGKEQER